MPLVMVCGLPAAGKSRRAQELAKYFQSKSAEAGLRDVVVIDDESLDVVKSDYYDRESEKRARGKQMSAVKRALRPDSLVILDNMTYIKGFRYQLFCEAKAAKATSCVLYVGTPKELAKKNNEGKENKWPEDLLDALVFRFEEPDGMTRWDSPLFVVTPEDELPYEGLWDSLINQKAQKPNASTLKKEVVSSDYLTTLNDTTSAIVKEALDLHSANPGAEVLLRGHRVQLPYALSFPQLTRIRRNFVSLNKRNVTPTENIEGFFIQFLEKNWELTS